MISNVCYERLYTKRFIPLGPEFLSSSKLFPGPKSAHSTSALGMTFTILSPITFLKNSYKLVLIRSKIRH